MRWTLYALALLVAAGFGYDAKAGGNGQERILMALHGGKTVVYIRHPHAIVGVDTDTKNLDNCETQRRLTAQGRRESVMIADAFRVRGLPVGQVLTSPFCRTRNAAFIGFGENKTVIEPALKSTCKTTTEAMHNSRVWLRERLSTAPDPGGNVLLMGHNCNLQNVLPAGKFPDCARRLQMGDAIVFRPEGEGFSLVGCVPLPTLKAWGGHPPALESVFEAALPE